MRSLVILSRLRALIVRQAVAPQQAAGIEPQRRAAPQRPDGYARGAAREHEAILGAEASPADVAAGARERADVAAGARERTRGSERQAARKEPHHDAERRRRVAEAAYFRAERRGFQPGYETADWLEAEREIDSGHPQEHAGGG